MPYIGTSPSNGVRRVYSYTATASQTTFSGASNEGSTLAYVDNNYLDVYQNGILLGSADYTSTNGTSVVLAQAASLNDIIVIIAYDIFAVSDTVSKKDGGTFDGAVTVNGAFTSQGIDDNADAVAITINSSEQVGIGTSSPSTTLDVAGTSRYTFNLSNAYTLQTSLNADASAFADDYKNASQHIWQTSGVERMRIESGSGRVLVGRTSAYSDGSIGNPTFQAQAVIGSHTGIGVITSGTASVGAMGFVNNNGAIGSITMGGTSTSYNTSSDYRLKENVEYTFDATTRLKQLKPCRFNFISDADTTVDGFLAHEVSSVVPEAINGDKDATDDDGNIVAQGIDQSKLVPLLVKTIQELEARITALENAE